MRKQVAAAFALVLLLTIPSRAGQSEQKPAADHVSRKLVTIHGRVGADGKILTSENGKAVWTVANPEALIDNIGDHVSVRAHVDLAAHEIRIATVRLEPTCGALLADAAFHR
jgi:hypothetical protein